MSIGRYVRCIFGFAYSQAQTVAHRRSTRVTRVLTPHLRSFAKCLHSCIFDRLESLVGNIYFLAGLHIKGIQPRHSQAITPKSNHLGKTIGSLTSVSPLSSPARTGRAEQSEPWLADTAKPTLHSSSIERVYVSVNKAQHTQHFHFHASLYWLCVVMQSLCNVVVSAGRGCISGPQRPRPQTRLTLVLRRWIGVQPRCRWKRNLAETKLRAIISNHGKTRRHSGKNQSRPFVSSAEHWSRYKLRRGFHMVASGKASWQTRRKQRVYLWLPIGTPEVSLLENTGLSIWWAGGTKAQGLFWPQRAHKIYQRWFSVAENGP